MSDIGTMAAFAMGQANYGKPHRVFDWDRAAQIIRERGAQDASAGLAMDWGPTSGEILSNGEPVPSEETYTYLASNWAIPQLEIDGEFIDCWRWKNDTEWDSGTYWPESALKILRGEASNAG